jgi:ADP-heptose:LPS heptosyltransferase
VNATENILIIRLKSIGDILFTLPAVHMVRQNFPDAKLHFMVSKEFVPLLRGFPEIDEVIGLDRSAFRSQSLLKTCPQLFRLVSGLREKRFSLVIDLQGYGETAWLSWLSGAPERWSTVYRYSRGWAYTRSEWRGKSAHPAEGHLLLLQRCGLRSGEIQNEYVLPAEAMGEARKFFEKNGLDEKKPTLFLQPFTSTPSHNWPLENFLALARHFQPRFQILFGGGPSEREALKPALDAGFVASAGVPLLVSAGLVKLSTLAVGGDTGLLHLAVAVGKRVVMLMPNPGTPTRPYQHLDWAIEPAPGKIAEAITINEVVEACERTLTANTED